MECQTGVVGPITRTRSRLLQEANTAKAVLTTLATADTVVINKEVTKLQKTPSYSDSFNGRLNWKARHYDKPVTSTPNETVSAKKVSKPHFKNPVGSSRLLIDPLPKPTRYRLDDSNTSIISPIRKPTPKTYKGKKSPQPEVKTQTTKAQLEEIFWKKEKPGPVTSTPVVVENGTKVVPTLTSESPVRQSVDVEIDVLFGFEENEPSPIMRKPTTKKTQVKKTTKTKVTTSNTRVLCKPSAQAWVKKMNKEFEDIDNFELCVEKTKPRPTRVALGERMQLPI